jgi:adenosylmethionine-8-amino-7-oxononanoate aminotransferase
MNASVQAEQGLSAAIAEVNATFVEIINSLICSEIPDPACKLDAMPEPRALQAAFLEKGVWIRPFRNVVYLTPAFVIGDSELDQLTSAVTSVLGAALRRA